MLEKDPSYVRLFDIRLRKVYLCVYLFVKTLLRPCRILKPITIGQSYFLTQNFLPPVVQPVFKDCVDFQRTFIKYNVLYLKELSPYKYLSVNAVLNFC